MYIFCFLTDVAITNSFILYKKFSTSPSIKSVKEFRLKLAKQLIGNYSSRKLPGRCSHTIQTLPLSHFPTKNQQGKRGRCKRCQPQRTDTPTYARSGFATMVILLLIAFWLGTRTSCSDTYCIHSSQFVGSFLYIHVHIMYHTPASYDTHLFCLHFLSSMAWPHKSLVEEFFLRAW